MKRVAKWFAFVVVLVLVVGVGIIGLARYKTGGKVLLTKEVVSVPDDPASIAEGRRLFVSRSCVDCHGDNLGGRVVIDDPVAGVMAGANLTTGRGGRAPAYKDDADWVMAIRHGVTPDGTKLVFMPSYEFHHFADDEVGRLIAYIKSVPPVDNEPPKTTPGLMLSLAYLMGDLPLIASEVIQPGTAHAAAVVREPGVELGRSLAQGCVGCHGPGFSGGSIPGTPPDFPKAANITPHQEEGIGGWNEADFIRAMREGKRPDGSAIDPFMPWKNFAHMTDDELTSLWRYLETVPGKPRGNR